ncbi:class I SAM-dependent methyltransferase [Halovivax limisalsi]|uniref:class I SAM-dependent methyltransferase n=1 Tax=Halovivax limisalsi TaxID=1453760 RepID=UPI001FFD4C6F|nr:class I SAM-dependent methyltransferase [Halovivax limisalsi]
MDDRTTNRRLWDAWSEDFQALWNADTADGEAPPAPCPFAEDAPGGSHPDILPTVEGIDFVELGCGGGQGSVGAALHGADTVVGVDFSGEQLAHARHLRDHYGVEAEFVTGDVTAVPLAEGSFDAAFSGWVYQMVEDLEACLKEAGRVLRDEGVLVLDVPHPFSELFDPENRELVRSYHGTDRRTIAIDEAYDVDMVVYDRTIADLHNALVDAGFAVERLLEPGSDDPEEHDDDPLESDRADLPASVPRNLRFWATVR